MKPVKFGIGQALTRVEDQRLITGGGRYTSDYQPEGLLHAVVLRSPHGHADFVIGDLLAARSAPGAKLVLTADDLGHLGTLPCLAPLPNSDGSIMAQPTYPVLAQGTVRHVGDAVAMVVAETAAAARDAAELIEVDYSAKDAVTDIKDAVAAGAPQVWPEAAGNIAYDTHIGEKAETDEIFASAAHTVSLTVVNNRLVANFMETRCAVGEYDTDAERYKLTATSQGVHNMQGLLSSILKIGSEKIHVLTPDVGGGFGTKAALYREYPLVLEAAKRLGAPVRWEADRTEHFIADAQGRDNLTTAEMALDENGRFLAMRIDIYGNLGAYLSQFAPYIPWLGASMATGTYDIPALYARVRGVYSHTLPVDAYRGAGRPEAAYVLERLVDHCARKLGLPRDEIRAKNFVRPSQMPYVTKTDRTYDVGDFEGAMRQSLANAEHASFEEREAQSKRDGKLRGIGFASYIECTAWGEGETGTVTLEDDGTFTVIVGTQSNGQGHQTAFAQVVSHYLDVPLERINLIQGDTDRVKTGGGSVASRSIPVGAAMLDRASKKLSIQLKELAGEHLEASVVDLEIVDGRVQVVGTDRAVSYEELVRLPGVAREKFTAGDAFVPPEPTYPNGTHVCEVEIDPETGATQVRRYSVCDDFGMTLNPLLLAGQVHGGIVQGIGQALTERTVYSGDGQLLTASFMDYAMPRASDMPMFFVETRNVPSTTNPMGLKGAGEAGTIGACPAVMNAVVDALYRTYGIEHIDMPATPAHIYRAIHARLA